MTISKNNKRFYSYNSYLKEVFGVNVHKLIIDAGFSCPNRDGTISKEGCIFCDESGSFGQTHSSNLSIKEQVITAINNLPKRFNAKKFIAYFQAYTNTYKPVEELSKIYNEALSDDRVVGISIGTRPDCIDEKKLELISSLRFPQIELGLQSAHNKTLKLINRGHDFETFVKGYKLAKSFGLKVCVHLILGLPNETRSMMLETAKHMADLEIDGIKLHVLTVLKGSKLAKTMPNIDIMSMEDYCNLVCDILEILPPKTTIQRLAGSGLRSELVNPLWVKNKFETLNLIDKILFERNSYQGKFYKS